MNTSHYMVAFAASLSGMLAGIWISGARTDDVLRGKRLEIVDDEGKSWITATPGGITILGEDDETSTQIRAQQQAHISFTEGAEVRCMIGLTPKGAAGMGTFYEGILRSYVASNEERSIVGVMAPTETLKDYMSLFDGTLDKQNAGRLVAFDGASELKLSGKDGKSKTMRNDDEGGSR